MESRVVLACMIYFVLPQSACGSDIGLGRERSPGSLEDVPSTNVVKPEFITEPEDRFVLSKSLWANLLCEARFVSNLNFHCTGGLPQREIHYNQTGNPVKLLIVEITLKNNATDAVCTCVATGYKGQVIKSRPAAIRKAYLDKNVVISPSANTRVPKNTMVTLKCKPPAGVPRPTVSWWKDGRLLDSSSRGVLFGTDPNFLEVIIRKAKILHGGYYTCEVSNLAGSQKSSAIKLTVYVDGGWSEWREFSPCNAPKCGTGRKMLKRWCSNPPPQKGGNLCEGSNIKYEPCQDFSPDINITCPDHINIFVNQSDVRLLNVSWNKPVIHSAGNDTKFSVKVIPDWAQPPALFEAKSSVYVIKYLTQDKCGYTASCSFNITVYNYSASACATPNCKRNTLASKAPPVFISTVKATKISFVAYSLFSIVLAVLLLVFIVIFVNWFRKKRFGFFVARQNEGTWIHAHERSKDITDGKGTVVSRCASYAEIPPLNRKLTAASPTGSEAFDFQGASEYRAASALLKGPGKTMQVEPHVSGEEREDSSRNFKRTYSCVSNKSTASEISRMMWNISNIPENADPKMVACGLVDHNGGKFTIGNTGVSLTVPTGAIPEGHTEGIYIAIVNREKEHPQITGKQSLLSPVVKCGPTGLKFQRPVILSIPHCALLDRGAWKLKVQYNESEPSTIADWKQLIDVSTQDGTEDSHVLVGPNTVHLMVDHFTLFAVIGESTADQKAERDLQVLAYVTPPEANSDCVVRVYCVEGTPAAIEDVHNHEIKKYRGETIESPQQLRFKDGGGDLLVELTDCQTGWQPRLKTKKIRFRDIWEGIHRLPSATFVFSLRDTTVSGFSAQFDVRQDCENGDEREVNVVTTVKRGHEESTGPRNDQRQSNTSLAARCEDSANFPTGASFACLMDHSTALLNAGSIGNPWHYRQSEVAGAYGGIPSSSPMSARQMSSGYFSVGFESLQTVGLLSRELRSKLALILDPPLESDWKVLADKFGLTHEHIKWIDSRKNHSPTEILFNYLETIDVPQYRFSLPKLSEILQQIGRDDAFEIVTAEMSKKKETEV
ncbi:unnamed protein product [Pocillopora meandrina]|uniref:Netrin receptor UNC5 n=1 Tax=Pocillopora meandrina TaxID=46732 RepID=A0AAU9VJ46_9CNID|nr:unnamed protein product [Pocillopora meandrina]